MAKKQAYETYYRDKFGELKVQLVDAVTGEPVTNPKEYEVIDSTQADMDELTGAGVFADAGSPDQVKPLKADFRTPEEIRLGSGRGDSKTAGKKSAGKGKVKGPSNNFGFIDKPKWSRFAGPAASLLGGPVAGLAVKAVDMGINVNNIDAKNAAREALGLPKKDASFFEKAKDVVKGPNDNLGELDIGKNKYDVSFSGGQNKKNKSALTFNEAVSRREALDRQTNPEKYSANLNSTLGKKSNKSNTKVTGKIGTPEGLDMVDGYRARLNSVNFDDFDLDPVTAAKAKEFQAEAKKQGLDQKLTVDVKDMVRTPERQAAIKATGKSWTTKSEHMAAMALDISPEDENDQEGWAAKSAIAASLGWGELGSKDPAHMGLTQSNKRPGALDMTKEQAISARNYFGNVPMSQRNKQALGIDDSVPTPMDRPTVARSIVERAKTPQASFFANQYAMAKEAGLTGLMADVAVAQAAIESGYGTGQLASTANNYHSIKAGTTWTGPTASFMDDEPGPSSFRQYANPVDSYKDWKSVMEKNFPGVLTAKDLPEAINALNNGVLGKYATAEDYGQNLTKAYNDLQESGVPGQMNLDPDASDFSRYSVSYFSKQQVDREMEEGMKNAERVSRDSLTPSYQASVGFAREDANSSGRKSFGANRPASGTASETHNMGRGDSPSSGRPSAASFGSSYTGKSGSTASPSEGIGRGAGSGMSKGPTAGSTANMGRNDSPSAGKPSSSSFGSTKSEKSEKSQGPSGGGYGGWGGPR